MKIDNQLPVDFENYKTFQKSEMKLNPQKFKEVLSIFREMNLVSDTNIEEVLSMFSHDYPFHQAMKEANSIHLHIKVHDTAKLPFYEILQSGAKEENVQPGYVKFSYEGGINMIFSSIPTAAEDLMPEVVNNEKPFLDHIGIDLRTENPYVYSLFNGAIEIAKTLGWSYVSQGGDRPVYCCHTEVKGKHWIFPKECNRWQRPIEFAYGPLQIHGLKMGCDLRPIDPAHPLGGKLSESKTTQSGVCCSPMR
jgi:hypothetical protein